MISAPAAVVVADEGTLAFVQDQGHHRREAGVDERGRLEDLAHPDGRPGRPLDINWAVRYLVSNEARFAHGTVFDVGGGITAVHTS